MNKYLKMIRFNMAAREKTKMAITPPPFEIVKQNLGW